MDIYIVKSRPVQTLTPAGYYRKIRLAYSAELERRNRRPLWGMGTACDNAAREMYSQMTGRRSNITELVTTQKEADQLFEYFKIFANVWTYQMFGGAERKASEKEQQINRIAEVLHSTDTEQLKELDIFVRTYIQSAR